MPSPWVAQLDRTNPSPLWQQLRADLEQRLDAGEFSDGFPSEMELCERYGVSRHTVRESLRALKDQGVITTGRGRRRRLTGPDEVITQPTGVVYSLFACVEASGRSQTSVVRVRDVRADGVIATRLGLEESTPLFHLERLRMADGLPLALDRLWMPASIGEPLLAVDFSHTSLYEELASITGIQVTGGEESVRAVIPSPAEHRTLGLEAPAAAFSVERTATSHGVAIEWRHTLIRADRFALTSTLSPSATGTSRSGPGGLALTPSYG